MAPRKARAKAKPKPQPKANSEMPGLTLDTSSSHMTSQASQINSHSRSASPVCPPYSPITPTLDEPARLATSGTGSSRAAYSHSQPPQTAISQPPPVPISLDENPDAIALKSAISILQIQARNASQDIRTLYQIKERAIEDPKGFAKALAAGEVSSKPDPLFNPSADTSGDEDEDEKGKQGNWGTLPTPQNVVRCPPINWAQYAIVGDSLDKLCKDQQSRPTEATPQTILPDGSLILGAEGQRRQEDLGVAAPYQPGKDKINRIGTRKGDRR